MLGRMGADGTTGSDARRYWDERAAENALWYVDTSLDYDTPDVDRFLADGARVVEYALAGPGSQLPGRRRAVEIGCGVGRICRALAEEFDEVVGVDISPNMVARARELVPDERVRFVVGDGTSLPTVADASVDLVLTYTVFQHVTDDAVIASYLHDCRRVLRPGGLLVAQWNGQDRATWWALRRRLRVIRARLGLAPRHARAREAAPFLGTRVPVDRMRAALRDAGLVAERITGGGTLFSWVWARRPDGPEPLDGGPAA